MISLKPKSQTKLPFITEVSKLKNSRKKSNEDEYPSRMGFDIGKIKNEILSELKLSKGKNY